MLTRERIRDGFVQDMVASSGHSVVVLSDTELAASRSALLAGGKGGDVWVFGYGSLIWNPAFHFEERRIAVIHGYHRRFCLWTHLGRGTPEQPGLILGLDRGGSCRGVAFRIRADAVASELDIIWRREMVSGSYTPRWVKARSHSGPLRAITFVINRDHERYASGLSDERIVGSIVAASGPLGPCADYLLNTAAHLDELGIHDRYLARLRARVLARAGS